LSTATFFASTTHRNRILFYLSRTPTMVPVPSAVAFFSIATATTTTSQWSPPSSSLLGRRAFVVQGATAAVAPSSPPLPPPRSRLLTARRVRWQSNNSLLEQVLLNKRAR